MAMVGDPHQRAGLKEFYEGNRFIFLIFGVIIVSFVMVAVAMNLYNNSGAGLLDASPPGFQDVRDKIVQDKTIASFPATGVFDKRSFDDFMKAYDESTGAITQVNGYDPAAVNNDSFNLASPTITPAP